MYNCGDLTNAIKNYMRTRDYATSQRHTLEMCMDVVRAGLESNNLNTVHSHIAKAETNPELAHTGSSLDAETKSLWLAKVHCANGLLHLEAARYKKAARCFLDVTFDLKNTYNDVIAPNDVAIYGVLCALATFERGELRANLIENGEWKQFLELEPPVREMLYSFYHGRYAQCLEHLDKAKVQPRKGVTDH
jgi:COP9 signalosome complex subunit 1